VRNPVRDRGGLSPPTGELGAVAVAAVLIALAAFPGAARAQNPADQPPFGGQRVPPLIPRPDSERPPPGFRLSSDIAEQIASGTDAAREAAENGYNFLASGTRDGDWEVRLRNPEGTAGALIVIDDATGDVVEAWTGTQVQNPLARGYPGAVAGIVNAVWIWLPLCALFLLPFIDPRRPFRLLHLDLVALLGFSVSLYFFNRGRIGISAPLVYPVLGYLFLRLVVAGFRREERDERLLPLAGPRLLVALIAGLVVLHAVIAIFEAKVIDVGLASVVGADRIAHGDFLYGVGSATGQPIRVDVYGPANYLAYLPFERLFPWSGTWDSVPAARAAALAFDLLTALCLYALGGRLRRGAEGRTLGLALAFAWLAYPFTLYAVGSSFNDGLVAFLVTASILVLASAPARGALAALAGLTKFGPLGLAPLLAAGTGERRIRSTILFALAFVAVAAAVTIPVLPDGGFRELYDRSLGYQAGRGSPFSVWGQAPSLHPLQTAAKAFAILFAVAIYFLPRRRGRIQVAALAGAAVVAIQVPATHWFYPYSLWFAPLVLVACLAPYRGELAPPAAPMGAAARAASRS
jgi:Glycosyltransferase family 87